MSGRKTSKVVDLTGTDVAGPAGFQEPRAVGARRTLAVEAFVRASMAFSFVILLGLVIVVAFTKTGSEDWANTKELLELAVPAITALLGSAVGFYFGAKARE